MNVLLVIHQFLPKYTGGTEVYTADLAGALRERGNQVALFTGGDEREDLFWEELAVTQVPGGARGRKGPVATFLTSFGNSAAQQAFRQVLESFQPDVVHFHHLLGLSPQLVQLAKERSIPTCYTLHDYWFMCPKSQLIDHRGQPCQGPNGMNCALCAAERLGSGAYAAATLPLTPLFLLRKRLVRAALARADLLLAPSRFLADLAVQQGLPREKVLQVELGTAFRPLAAERRPRAQGAPLRVSYLGAVEQSKGVHILIEACRHLEPGQAEVRIAGDLAAYPRYSQGLQRAAEGLPITFVGPLAREAVQELLATTDVLVVPSLWYENAPRVVAEGFAAGVPVVASRIGALAEKVQEGFDGLLFTPGDPKDLARVLQRLAKQPSLLAGLQAQTKRGPSWDEHVDHMESIYRQLTALTSTAGARR